jgi:hypothetical protein
MSAFEFEEVVQAEARFAKRLIGGIQICVPLGGRAASWFRKGVEPVGVSLGRDREEPGFQGVVVQPWTSGFVHGGKEIQHARDAGASGTETLPTGATGCGVGVLDLEPAALKGIDVVEFGPGDIKGALGIDDHLHAGGLNQDVAILGSILEVHLVLQPGATAADDRNPQHT